MFVSIVNYIFRRQLILTVSSSSHNTHQFTGWPKKISPKQLSGQCSLLHQFILAGCQVHS